MRGTPKTTVACVLRHCSSGESSSTPSVRAVFFGCEHDDERRDTTGPWLPQREKLVV